MDQDNIIYKHMPRPYINLAKKKLSLGEWNLYIIKNHIENDIGFEVEYDKDGFINSIYNWHGKNEYCFTSSDYYETIISKRLRYHKKK